MALNTALDWTSKGLTLLLVLLAALFVLWQCLEGLAKITVLGNGFRHYCANKHIFERWLKEMREQEARESKKGGANG